MKTFLAALATLCMTTQVFGNGTVVGKVIRVRIDQNGWGMVMFDQPLGSSPPTCVHSAYTNALAFDANTAAGKSIMANICRSCQRGDKTDIGGDCQGERTYHANCD